MSDDSREDAGGRPAPQQQPAPGEPQGRFVRVQFPRDWTARQIVD